MITKPLLEQMVRDLGRADHLEDRVQTTMTVLRELLEALQQTAPCDHTHYLTTDSTFRAVNCQFCGEMRL